MEVQAVTKIIRQRVGHRLPARFYYRKYLRRFRRPLVVLKNRIKFLASGEPWTSVCVNAKNDMRYFVNSYGKDKRIYDALFGVWRPV